MLFPFAKAALAGKRGKDGGVHMLVEWRQFAPLVQVAERLLAGSTLRELLQQCGVAGAEAPPLRGEPRAERRAARKVEAFQEIPFEQHRQAALPLRRQGRDARLHGLRDRQRIDKPVCQV
ncbi:hypothetical protein [Cupriavidus oxalaticus]|uniref:hypothetical protein n=1 Tax=Cupriavidus oxalaticus TaxID=96344 RepID=UPI001E5547F0|nr:hypothetical protein [Cupriavidus oxalaticus]